MVFVQKSPLFQPLFLAIYSRKMSFTIFQHKKQPFQAIKTRSSKSQKIDIFPKGLTHRFGTKMAVFPNFFFLGNIGKENVFHYILEQKKSFQAIKRRSLKSPKIHIFTKVFTNGFCPKITIIPTSFFGNIFKENVFHDILAQKIAFLGYKNTKFKKSKN